MGQGKSSGGPREGEDGSGEDRRSMDTRKFRSREWGQTKVTGGRRGLPHMRPQGEGGGFCGAVPIPKTNPSVEADDWRWGAGSYTPQTPAARCLGDFCNDWPM